MVIQWIFGPKTFRTKVISDILRKLEVCLRCGWDRVWLIWKSNGFFTW